MGVEKYRPHELAKSLEQAGYEIVDGRVESEKLCGLIEKSEEVWHELQEGMFEQDEHGHVTFVAEDWVGDYQTDSGDHVDGWNVHFTDARGIKTQLGRVRRVTVGSQKATAEVMSENERMRPVLPEEREWDAVVGVLEDAIGECLERKRANSSEADE